MTIDQQQPLEARVERALFDLELRLKAARRRERRATAACVAALLVAAIGWTPLLGQGSKTMEERVTDLEKRTGGFQIDNGITRLTAPVEIFDAGGQKIAVFSSDEAGGRLAVGGADKGYVLLGNGSNGGGIVQVHGVNRKRSVVLGSPATESGHGLFVMDNAGTRAQATLKMDAEQPRLIIGTADSGGIGATVGEAGAGLLTVREADGNIGVAAGKSNSFRMGVYALGENGSSGVSLYSDKLGGNVRVHNPKGAAVGGLFSEEEGGGLVLTAPEGGDSIVDLGVRDSGGSVRVFSVGGSTTRAALEASQNTGGVTAYASDGQPAITLTSRPGGSGYLQILQGGTTMVEAGVSTDGVGVVRAGPSAPRAVGALAIPHRIIGSK